MLARVWRGLGREGGFGSDGTWRICPRLRARTLAGGVTALLIGAAAPAVGSPFYDVALLAGTGSVTDRGETIAAVKPEVSVNESGRVAFIAEANGVSNLLLADRIDPPRNLSLAPDGVQHAFPQINNVDQVVCRELRAGKSVVRLWRASSPGFGELITSTLGPWTFVTLPTLSNVAGPGEQPLVAFVGKVADLDPALFVNDSGERDRQDELGAVAGTGIRPMLAAAAHRAIVVRDGSGTTGTLRLGRDPDALGLWEWTVLATTEGEWQSLGTAPGISDTGRFVAFAGEHKTTGPGVYLVDCTAPTGPFHKLAGLDSAIALDEAGAPIGFASFDLTGRVGVLHQELGAADLPDDCVTVAFVGTPARASGANPHVPGRPLLFSRETGVWTVRADIEWQLQAPRRLVLHLTSPTVALQVGETVGGAVVEGFTLYDPLSLPLIGPDGAARRPARGDHYLAFTVETMLGPMVVGAASLDSDGDGLFDHWETAGIDIDSDGTADLRLWEMDADPMRRDLFLEIDWLGARETGWPDGWSNAPAPGVTERLLLMFADAPVANPDGTRGISLHIDAGPESDAFGEPYSMNMGTPPRWLDGGDRIGMTGAPEAHPDVIHLGLSGAVSLPGLAARDLTSVKDEFFGARDKGARELAFKYAVLADFNQVMRGAGGNPQLVFLRAGWPGGLFTRGAVAPDHELQGHAVKILTGKGAGQVRRIRDNVGEAISVSPEWLEIPDATSLGVVLGGWSGRAEVHFLPEPDNHSRPTNDFLVTLGGFGVNTDGWLGNAEIQWRTLAHELGHTLGLRHGGTDHEAYKGASYLSLMSYSYQLKVDSGVDSFSGGDDPTFDDWGYYKSDFSRSACFLGNSFGIAPGAAADDRPDMTVAEYEAVNEGPVDLTPPRVTLTAPATGATVPQGGNLIVHATAADDVRVASVVVTFDVDGDGVAEGETEVRPGLPAAVQGRYFAMFENVTGPLAARAVTAIAADSSGNRAAAVAVVRAGAAPAGGQVLRTVEGTFVAQPPAFAGGRRQYRPIPAVAVPGSGRLVFTVEATPALAAPPAGRTVLPAAVETVALGQDSFALSPSCTGVTLSPVLATSSWRAWTGGAVNLMLGGPALMSDTGGFLGSPAQSFKLTITFEPVDVTPPAARIVSPARGEFVELGGELAVVVEAGDDYAVGVVAVAFDRDGDGDDEDAGERVAAARAGTAYRATFPGLAGAPGTRAIRVAVTDTAGLETRVTGAVEARAPDRAPPRLVIVSPLAGTALGLGQGVLAEVEAYDDAGLASLTAQLDLDGDGDVTGPGELQPLARVSGVLHRAEFGGLTGPFGARTLEVIALDPSGNESRASVPITLGGAAAQEELIHTTSGTIPAQPGWWGGGSRQVLRFDPIALSSAGAVRFVVTATPNVRQANQNIPRYDPFVWEVTFGGNTARLGADCNAYGANPSVCTSRWDAPAAGALAFAILGPSIENIWGEFEGHPAQDYTLEVFFTADDILPPTVTIVEPAAGAAVPLGEPLTAKVTAFDESGLASVLMILDINGDGDTADFGESLAATAGAGGLYQAVFPALAGPPGARLLTVQATDTSFNTRTLKITVGAGGVGAGEVTLFSSSGTIPAQRSDLNGGQRQRLNFGPIQLPGVGRITLRVRSWPNVRQAVANLERHDAHVERIWFDGEPIALGPACNAPGSDPALCESVWDSPRAGELRVELMGPAEYNIWGEFEGHPNQRYELEMLFLPGPAVTGVIPPVGGAGGWERVSVRGAGFAENAVVLFAGVAAEDVQRIDAGQLTCLTPPGVPGVATVIVLNPDPDELPWNYGRPYGLFGTREGGFVYVVPGAPQALAPERLLGTFAGAFTGQVAGDAQGRAAFGFAIPGAGRVRFETWAFPPILSPIPGPFEDPDDLTYHNESSGVTRFTAADGSVYWLDKECSDLAFLYGPVVCGDARILPAAAAGTAAATVTGPARWNAFWRQFGEFELESAPAQTWSAGVWFADQPGVAAVVPATGTTQGGLAVTLLGSNLASGVEVLFGAAAASDVTVVSRSLLTCRTPPGAAGTVAVTVRLLDMTAALPSGFRYTAEPGVEATADVTSFRVEPGGDVVLSFASHAGKPHQLQRTERLNPPAWTDVGAPIAGTGGVLSVTDPGAASQRAHLFYRVLIGAANP